MSKLDKGPQKTDEGHEIDYSKIQATVCYLIRDDHVLLVKKGRNIGMGKLVGVGGKQEKGEDLEQTARRETEEEIKVKPGKIRQAAEIEFVFPHNPKYGQRVFAYIVDTWEGEPQTTDEALTVEWHPINDLPTAKMWHDNSIWLPLIFAGKTVKGRFVIGPNDRVTEYVLEEI